MSESEQDQKPVTPEPLEDSRAHDDLTRRQWLLRLGEMVALAGVSGMVPDAAALLRTSQPESQGLLSAQALPAPLPPGLYDPSQEHLIHAMSAKTFSPPEGSETGFVKPRSGPFQPQFFTAEEFRVVTRVAEVMLGKIDPTALADATEWLDLYLHSAAAVRAAALRLDPLHRALAVAYSGEDVVRELETADPASAARAGLIALQELSALQYQKKFLELTEPQQLELLAPAADAKPSAEETGSGQRTHFDLLRRQLIHGYYTSAAGIADLDYKGNAWYPECPGCDGKS